jgi:NADPH:quinone reductase-like Zn-dependent oxidoreductase
METCQQVWINRIGPPSVLQLKSAAMPKVGDDEILIKVKASGVNFADILARMGIYPDAPKLPAVVGYEVSGVIEQIGSKANGFKRGDRVLALTRFGGYASHVCVHQDQVLSLPQNLTFEEGAALPVNYLTAWIMLVHLGNVRPGESVLIHAAAGGVGLAALQICKWKKATTLGTASKSKHPRLLEMGLSHAIDYRTQDFETEVKKFTQGKGVDIIIDAVGGNFLKKDLRVLKPLGRLYCFGASSMATSTRRSLVSVAKLLLQMPRISPITLMNQNQGIMGVNMGHLWEERALLKTITDEIIELAAKGIFKPVTSADQSFSFKEAAKAHQFIQDRKNFGKVLLIP